LDYILKVINLLPQPILVILVFLLVFYFFQHIKRENKKLHNRVKILEIDIEAVLYALELKFQNGFSQSVIKKRVELTKKWENLKDE